MTEKRLSHAYMLVAPEGAGRTEEAERLASALLCASPEAPCGRCRDCRKSAAGLHPDRIWLTRQKDDKGNLRREVYVDQIRAMTADAAVAPNESARKVYVIRDAERMNLQAQNALLKALDQKVLLGGLAGGLLAVGNFFFMAIGTSLAADKAEAQNVKGGQALIQTSYLVRMIVLAVLLFACAKSGYFNLYALVIPLLFPRLSITLAEFFRKKGD